MKFTDGYWMMRPGVKAHYAAEVYEWEGSETSLTAFAPTRQIRHRGDTLEGPILTVEISSPLEDVLRVRLSHDLGAVDRGPHFEVADTRLPVQIEETDETLSIKSGCLAAHIDRKNWAVDFVASGERVTRSPGRGMGYLKVDGQGTFLHDQLSLGVGECVYGLGERFAAFVKNGQTVDIWNRDGGTGSEQAYKNIPFYLTNRGYGVFVNHTGEVSFEVASEKVSRVQFSVPGESIEYFVIYGPTPKEVLAKYTALTGRPALPPAWSFGLWLSTSFTTSYDEETVTSFLNGMEERRLPLSVFHFDCFWMRAFHWCDFEWDPTVFPDPRGMLSRLKERGLRICVWINPYIAQRSKLFAEAADMGYLIKKPNGDVWQWDMWQPGMAIVDFTNPDACAWFAGKLKGLVEMGVDAFKTDFGERIPTDVSYHDGSDPVRMHNYYTYLYNKVVYEALAGKVGEDETILFARSATAGGQKFPVHWGGDCYSDYESMAESLRGGLSLGLSGFGFWSHDIGGFEGTPPFDVYKRWLAFGLLSSHSRLHGSSSYRVPWLFDDEAVDVLRTFTNLKCRLMPYLYAKAIEATESGVPMMRAMAIEFPEDRGCDYLDRQYMLGDRLLVAPVFSESGEVDVYVPEGTWTSLLTGETFEGPRWTRQTHDVLSVPLLVRPNTLLPVGGRIDRPDYDYDSDLTFRLFALQPGGTATVRVPSVDGRFVGEATASRVDQRLEISWTSGLNGVRFELIGIEAALGCEGGVATPGERGLLVVPAPGKSQLSIQL